MHLHEKIKGDTEQWNSVETFVSSAKSEAYITENIGTGIEIKASTIRELFKVFPFSGITKTYKGIGKIYKISMFLYSEK